MRALIGALRAAVLVVGGASPAAAAQVAHVRRGRDRECQHGEKATTHHRFRIASNAKAFTAAVVLQLTGDRLDEPVSRWLSDIPDGITVRQLLNHISGLYDPTDEKAFWAPYFAGDRGYVYRPRDIVATAVARPLTNPPGAKYDYSNTNYLVAGLLIEKTTGHSAVSEVYRRILMPLHLVRTSFPTRGPYIHGTHLHGYDLSRRTDLTVFSPSYDWTAGAIVSTVGDREVPPRAVRRHAADRTAAG